jgi:hypothetical protein
MTAGHGVSSRRKAGRPEYRQHAAPADFPWRGQVPALRRSDQRAEKCSVDREELGLLSRYPAAPRHLLTVDEYHRMGEAGILTENDRVEIVEGELVAMAPIGS